MGNSVFVKLSKVNFILYFLYRPIFLVLTVAFYHCPKLFKLNADVSWLELIFIHYTGQLMKLISSSF